MIRKLIKWLKGLIKKLKREIEELVPIAVKVTDAIKKAVNNDEILDLLEIIKDIVPSEWDDFIIDRIVKICQDKLPEIAIQLKIINASLSDLTNEEKVQLIIENLRDENDEIKSDFWHRFSSECLKALTDELTPNKITLGEAAVIVEGWFKSK